MKGFFAVPVFGFLIYQAFTSEMSRNAWHSAGGITTSSQQESSEVAAIQPSNVSSDALIRPVASTEEGCYGRCIRMLDSERRPCWSAGAQRIIDGYVKTHELGNEFIVDGCPEGRVIGIFKVHSNSPKGVTLYFLPNSPAFLTYNKREDPNKARPEP